MLHPHDRLMLVSDGATEAHDPTGAEFGDAALPAALLASRHLPPIPAVRAVQAALRRHGNGRLHDDATVFCLDWHGPPSPQR